MADKWLIDLARKLKATGCPPLVSCVLLYPSSPFVGADHCQNPVSFGAATSCSRPLSVARTPRMLSLCTLHPYIVVDLQSAACRLRLFFLKKKIRGSCPFCYSESLRLPLIAALGSWASAASLPYIGDGRWAPIWPRAVFVQISAAHKAAALFEPLPSQRTTTTASKGSVTGGPGPVPTCFGAPSL